MRIVAALTAVALAALAPLAAPALADGKRMMTEAEAAEWRGVGRLNVAGRRFCTATLVSERLAITAAHCLYNPRTKRAAPLEQFRFVAGLRLGAYAAVRRVTRTATLPDYRYSGEASLETIGADVALIELSEPIVEAAPFAMSSGAGWAPAATVVSYARDRAHAPSIQQPCRLRRSWGRVAALDCDVTYGASGAPVFAGAGAGAKLVGVISAMSDGGAVALAVLATPALARLEARLDDQTP
jgi:V8-like Glu-specific endopeptidase